MNDAIIHWKGQNIPAKNVIMLFGGACGGGRSLAMERMLELLKGEVEIYIPRPSMPDEMRMPQIGFEEMPRLLWDAPDCKHFAKRSPVFDIEWTGVKTPPPLLLDVPGTGKPNRKRKLPTNQQRAKRKAERARKRKNRK